MHIFYQEEKTGQHVFIQWDKDQAHIMPEKDYYKAAVFNCDAAFTAADHGFNDMDFSSIEVESSKHVSFSDLDLSGCSFSGAKVGTEARLSFTKVNLTGASFRDFFVHDAFVHFTDSDLSNVDFTNLKDVPPSMILFQNCKMNGVDWSEVPNLGPIIFSSGTDLSQSKIGLTQLAQAASVSADCLLPDGITHEMVKKERSLLVAALPSARAWGRGQAMPIPA